MQTVINVYSTNVTAENLSRHELLAWVNKCLGSDYMKVEQLCTGNAYCYLLESMFPKSIPIRKVKTNPVVEIDSIHNFKLLQTAFQTLNIDKSIDINRLTKGKFQDNFEFLQWFKKFYDANTTSERPTTGRKQSPSRQTQKINEDKQKLNYYIQENKDLEKTIQKLNLLVQGIEEERDFYYQKLRTIEDLISNLEKNEIHEKVLSILYETKEGFVHPNKFFIEI